MTYPYGSIATGKVDGTALHTDHPNHHNAIAGALNDLLAILGTAPDNGAGTTTAALAALTTLLNPVSLAHGGTNSTTALDALTTLGVAQQIANARYATPTPNPGLLRTARSWPSRSSQPIKGYWIGDSEIAFAQINRPFSTALGDQINPPNRQLSVWNAAGFYYPGDGVWGIGGTGGVGLVATTTTGVSQTDVQAHRGAAGHALQLTNGKDITFPSMTFDKCTLRYLLPLSGSGATLDMYIDGVLAPADTTFSANAAGTHTITVTPGAHVIKLVSHGVTLIDYVQLFYGGNDAAGYQPMHTGHGGYQTADFNNATLTPYLAADLTLHDPDFVILQTATNDADAATFFADMQTLITFVKANCTADVVLVMNSATLGDTTWETFRYYARRLARTNNILLVEVSEAIPDLSASDAFGYTLDGVHYSTMGRQIYAQCVFRSLFQSREFDPRAVDGFGLRYAQKSMWKGTTTFSGNPGICQIVDSGSGGMAFQIFLSDADTVPFLELSTRPNALQNGLRMGPGGSTALDSMFLRARPAVWAVTDSLSLGSSGNAVITGVRLASTIALPACTYNNGASGVGATLTGNANGQLADQDFTTPSASNRLLIKDQADQTQNGIYAVTQLGDGSHPFILTRTSGADANADYNASIFAFVAEGHTQSGSLFRSRPIAVTVGTTPISWHGISRTSATPADTAFGSNRDRQRYSCDFEESDTAITTINATTRWPGTSFSVCIGNQAGAQATQNETTDTLPGVLKIETGSTTSGRISIQTTNRAFTFDQAKRYRFYTRAKIGTLQTGTDDFVIWLGFADNMKSDTDPTGGLFFRSRRSGGVNLNWECVARQGGTETAVDSGIATTTFFQQFTIIYEETEGVAYFYIGTALVTPTGISTNLPTLSGQTAVKLKKVAGTSSSDLRVDYMETDQLNSRTLTPLIP